MDSSAIVDLEAARLLLVGAIAALLARVAWGVFRSAEDRVIRLAVVWAGFVLLLVVSRILLSRFTLSPAEGAFFVRLQYFAALTPIPLLVLASSGPSTPRRRAVTTLAVGGSAIVAALSWVDGAIVARPLVDHHWAVGGSYRTLTPGPLLPLLWLVALGSWLATLWLIEGAEDVDRDDTRTLVRGAGALLVVGGANDSLMDAGLVESVPLIEAACFGTLLGIGALLSRRARAAFGGARDRIEAQTRELERHHHALALRERQMALGALASGLGHEINNPLTVVSVNLERATELLSEFAGLRDVRESLEECRRDCRAVARAIAEFGTEEPEVESPPKRPSSETPGASARHQILVVDDEPLVARSLRRALRPHQVTVAHGGSEALQLVRERTFDRILCDVMMPGMSGPEFYGALRKEGLLEGKAFAFVTGGAFSADVARAVEETKMPVLRKPVDVERLRDVLHMATPKAAADPGRGLS